jgi:aerobic C4-dicarboxylate transport protein
MRLAPVGTFGAVASAVGSSGWAVLLALIYLVLSFYAVIILFIVVVMGLIAKLFGFSLFKFVRYIRDEVTVVFGTASSESGLPRLLEKLQRLGCSKQSVGLVLPTGYAFNLDGTSIYMTMSTIFIANAYGITLEWHRIIGLLGVMLLTSKGAATVSGGTFVVFAATVTTTGILPLEGLPLIFGVYRFMSMINAVCNAVGNCVAAVVVSKICGEFDPPRRVQNITARLGRQ